MAETFICDAIRTPIDHYGSSLSTVRTDDLGTVPLKALMARSPRVDWSAIDDVVFDCTDQAGEDNRNVARMSSLLTGLPDSMPGSIIDRLCSSDMDATGTAAHVIRSGETTLMIAGGVESMNRAPFVMSEAANAFSRNAAIYDTTTGWRFINPLMKAQYGVDLMPETAENIATDYKVNRGDQDRFAPHSRANAARAQEDGTSAQGVTPVTIPQGKSDAIVVGHDEHPRTTSMEALAKLGGVVRPDGIVTAGNASSMNGGACVLLLVNEASTKRFGLTPRARIVGMTTAGVPSRVMGIGPAPTSQKLLKRLGLSIDQMGVIELNEAFAAQDLAVTRQLGLHGDDPRINPNGGAITLGHPLGMSGARLITAAMYRLQHTGGCCALYTMCIGVGQGITLVIERV